MRDYYHVLQDDDDDDNDYDACEPTMNKEKRTTTTAIISSNRHYRKKSVLKKVGKLLLFPVKRIHSRRRHRKHSKQQQQTHEETMLDMLSMPREINVIAKCCESVYSAVSGATGLPDPKGRSMMTSILPDLVADTESDTSPILLTSMEPNTYRTVVHATEQHEQLAWYTRTKYFKALVEWVFYSLDAENTGAIDKKELYSGILLIHITLAKYALGCQPPSSALANQLFESLDVSRTGTLNKRQFTYAMTKLSSPMLSNMLLQWCFLFMVVVLIVSGDSFRQALKFDQLLYSVLGYFTRNCLYKVYDWI